jgi:HAD superfamily hydrolase (TIGR01509 family)
MSAKLKYKFILSDLDGVIRTYPFEHSQLVESEYGIPPGTLLPMAFQKKLLEPAITGKVSDEVWREQVAVELSKVIEAEKAREAIAKWSAFPGKLEIEVINLLKAHKPHSQLALLTNGTSRLNKDLKTLGIFHEFNFIFNTCEIGFIKPDARSFEHVLNQLKCKPDEIVFIDDRYENIEMAMSLGIHSHHYRDYQQLESFIASQS